MEGEPFSSRASGKLESLPKEELLKFIRKQALNTKELKNRIKVLSEELSQEANENAQLQNEKKEWLKQEISQEFEKKNKYIAKDNELQLAAQLGKEMLAENDDLHGELEDVRREHDHVIQTKQTSQQTETFEDELQKMVNEKENMQNLIDDLEDELMNCQRDVESLREELTEKTSSGEKELALEIENLKETIKTLESNVTADETTSELQALKKEHNEILNANETMKGMISNIDQDNKFKSEHILSMDTEMKALRKEIAEYVKERAAQQSEIENLCEENNMANEIIKTSETKIQELQRYIEKAFSKHEERVHYAKELDGDYTKLKAEKEKQGKTLKSVKTKLERSSQMEEELKKQLNIIVGERDDLLKKQQKLLQKLKNKTKLANEEEFHKEQIKDMEQQLVEQSKELSEMMKKESSLTEANQKLTDKTKKLQDQLDDVLVEKEKLFDTCTSQEGEFKRCKEEILESATIILKLESRVEELLAQLQTMNEEKMSQECELEELFASHDDLRNKYEFECEERERKEVQVHGLEERLEKLQREKMEGETTIELHQQIQQLSEEVDRLNTQEKKLKQEILVKGEHLLQVRNEFDDSLKRQSETNSSNHKEIDRIVEDFRVLDSELTATKNELNATLRKNEELARCMAERDLASQSAVDSSKETEDLCKRAEFLSAENQRLVSSYEDLTRENSELREFLSEKDNELNNVKLSAENNYNTVCCDMQALSNKYEKLGQVETELRCQLQSLEEECLGTRNICKKFSCSNATELCEHVASLVQNESKLNIEVRDAQLSNSALKNSKEQLESALEELSRENENKVGGNDDDVAELSTLNAEIAELKELLNEKEVLLGNINVKFNTTKSINVKLEDENTQLSTKLQTMHSANETLRHDLCMEEERFEQLKVLLDAKLELLETYKQNSNHDIEELKSEIESLRTENSKLSTETDKLNVSYQSNEEELQSALNRVDELEMNLKEKDESADRLESLVREKGEKGNKFRNVAIKSKKELEGMRLEFEREKNRYEHLLSGLNAEVKRIKNEMVVQKTECSKHEEEFHIMQGEIKQLNDEVEVMTEKNTSLANEKQMQVERNDELSVACSKVESEVIMLKEGMEICNQTIRSLSTENEKIKQSFAEKERLMRQAYDEKADMQKMMQEAKKDSQQLRMMRLEIDDYLKTIERLQAQISGQQVELSDCHQDIEKQNALVQSLLNEKGAAEKETKKSSERNKKLKTLITKLKSECSEANLRAEEGDREQQRTREKCENVQNELQELKMVNAELTVERERLREEMEVSSEVRDRSYHSLEVKNARLSNDLISSQRLYHELQEEHENYKVRAHNVLKQQKVSGEKEETHRVERERLESMVDDLQVKLVESNAQLMQMRSEYGGVEIECEKLQVRNEQFAVEVAQVQVEWNKKYEGLRSETDIRLNAQVEKFKAQLSEKEELIKLAEGECESKSREINKLLEEVSDLKDNLKNCERDFASSDSNEGRQVESKAEFSLLFDSKSFLERQEGEGMDSKELELISQRSASLPQTPISPTSSQVLESILSPTLDNNFLLSPSTPGSLKEEIFNLRSSLLSCQKKNEHFTVVLRENEENTSRMEDQVKLLKEEIRRLERNIQREQALSNLEYLKNVIIKFLKVSSMEREQLIPVFCTMLKLSDEEKKFMTEYAKGGDKDATEQPSSWSNYVYRWTGVS